MPPDEYTSVNDHHAPRLLLHSVDWTIRRRMALLVCCLVTAAAAIVPSLRLKFDRSVEGLFHQGNPRFVNYREGKRLFGGAETGLVAYDDPELLTVDGLRRLERLDKRLRQVVGVRDVLSIRQAALPSAPLSSQSLIDHLEAGVSEQCLREELLGCTLYRNRLISADGKTALLLVDMTAAGDGSAQRDKSIADLREICRQHDPPAVLAGGPVLIEDVYRHLEQDGRTLGIASSLVLAVVIAVLFRNLRWIVLPLAVVHLTLVWTKALLVASGARLSMVSSPLVALVTVIGVTTVVHVAIRFREERSIGGEPKSALRRTLIHVGPAIFWTCLTTAVGFCSLLISRIVPVGGFGAMMALGSALVFAATIGLIPAGVLLGRYSTDPGRVPGESAVAAALGKVAAAVERHPWPVAATGLIVLGVTALGIFRLEVATDFDENFRKSSPIVKSHHFIADRMGMASMFDVLVDTPAMDRPEEVDDYLKRLRALQNELASENGVAGTLSIVDLLDFVSVKGEIEPDAPAVKRWMVEQLENMSPGQKLPILHSLKSGLVGGFWNKQHNVARIIVQTGQLRGTEAKQQRIERIEAAARRIFPSARTAGVEILLTYLVKSMLVDQWTTFSLAVAAILTMLMVAFRDWRLGLLALAPNVAPVLIVVGVMGWLGLKVNMATAMLASVSMGLAVDFSIHYLYRFQHELRMGKPFGEALHSAHGSVGMAMVLANVALIAGFSTLLLSAFIPTVHFGILISFVTVGGLLGNLTVLPLLLRLLPGFVERRKREGEKKRGGEGATRRGGEAEEVRDGEGEN